MYEFLRDLAFEVTGDGGIFGNRYIICDKFETKEGTKTIVYFDLQEGKMYIKEFCEFCYLVKNMELEFTKDIINIDYANEERGD